MAEKINPYIAGAPVVETRMFFGREDVFSWIERSLSGKFVNHILVIHGQRRVGKTSVLKHIGNRLPDRFIPIFVDLQGRVNTTLPRFLWWLSREISRALNLPEPERELFEGDPEYFESEFLLAVEKQLGDKVLLLVFDEFDTLETTVAQEGLALPFMAILKRLMEHEGLNFIFSIGSSGRKLENMQAAYTSFFKQALYRKISFLTEADARELIVKPVEGIINFDLDAVDLIYEITSGHPYFIQLICHELFSLCQKSDHWQINKANVEGILDAVIERGTVNLKFVWDESSELEKWILATLAQLKSGTDLDTLEKNLNDQKVRFIRQDLESAILHLREKDILASSNRFVIYLLKLWLIQNRSLEQVREELNKVNPIVSRLLQIGHQYLDQGDLDKAIASFMEALQAEEDNYEVRMGLASANMLREDFGRAASEYEEILTLYPEDVAAQSGYCDAYLSLGDVRFAMDRLDEAEFAYRQVLKISPRHTDGQAHLAQLYRHRAVNAISGGEEIALEQARKALELVPEDAELQASVKELENLAEGTLEISDVLLAWGQRSQKNEYWQEAVDLLTSYQRLKGEDKNVLPILKDLRLKARTQELQDLKNQSLRLERLGQFDDAIFTLDKYLSLKPEDAGEVSIRIQELKEARKSALRKEEIADFKPLWKKPLVWVLFVSAAILAAFLLIPGSPLRLALAPQVPTAETIIQERVVVATSAPAIAPSPTPEPLPYKWTRVTSAQFLERDYVQAVAIHPFDADIIYAGTRSSGVYRTNDGGVSWQPVSNGITVGDILQIIIDPNNPNIVYASVRMAGVFKTIDSGETWRWLDTEVTDPQWGISNLFMNPSDASHLVFTNGAMVSESRDFGESWVRLDIPFRNPGLVGIDPESGNLIAVAGKIDTELNVKFYLSDAQRTSWQLTHEFKPKARNTFQFIKYDPVKSKFFVSSSGWDGVQSVDGGLTWKNSGSEGNLAISAEGDYFTAGWGNHTLRIKNEDLYDSLVSKRISNTRSDVYSIAVAPSNSRRIVTGGHADVGGASIWITDDGGDSWQKRVNGLGAIESIFGFDPDSHLIYIGQYTQWLPGDFGNFFSYDLAGNSFQNVVKGTCGSYPTQPWEKAACGMIFDEDNPEHESIPWDQIYFGDLTNIHERDIVNDPLDQQSYFLATDNGVYLSSDGGKTWDAINDGFGNMRIVYGLEFDPQNPEDLYALTPYGIYKLEEK